MKLNGKWVEIFRTGRHTDSKGRVRDWTGEDLDHAVKAYDPANHEAPNVVGHPADNQPAYGWIAGLKRSGEVLMAKLRKVPKEFEDMVSKGLFRKRSVSFYPDGTLRHVGWLGAQPPAVKGLKDVAFKADESFSAYDLEDQGGGGTGGNPTDNPDNPDVEDADMGKEEELQKQLDEANAKLATETTAREAAEGKLETASKEHSESEQARKTQARQQRFEQLVAAKKVAPGAKAQVLAFAEALEKGSDETVSFAEGQPKKTLVDHFWENLEKGDVSFLFREMEDPEGKEKDEAEFKEDETAAAAILGDRAPAKK